MDEDDYEVEMMLQDKAHFDDVKIKAEQNSALTYEKNLTK